MTTAFTALCFLVVALIYGSVGFGGGSSYTALLTLSDLPPHWIPVISLTCNVIVVAGSAVHFIRRGHLAWPMTWPFLATSVPCAYLGGRWPLEQDVFLGLLGGSLVVAGLSLLLQRSSDAEPSGGAPPQQLMFGLGAGLGLLSGLVGIGGGVFLAPLLLRRRWGTPKEIAATSALFILANSAAGLVGQFGKLATLGPLVGRWPLFAAVVVGGQAGSLLGSGPFPQGLVRAVTALLVAAAGLRVLWHLMAAAAP